MPFFKPKTDTVIPFTVKLENVAPPSGSHILYAVPPAENYAFTAQITDADLRNGGSDTLGKSKVSASIIPATDLR